MKPFFLLSFLLSFLSIVHSIPNDEQKTKGIDLLSPFYKSYYIRTGKRPGSTSDLIDEAALHYKDNTSFKDFLGQVSSVKHGGSFEVPYYVRRIRIDGNSIDSPISYNARCVYVYTDTFVENELSVKPSGDYVVMWDDYLTSSIPYDLISLVYTNHTSKSQSSKRICFDGEYGKLQDAISYQEYFSRHELSPPPPYQQDYRAKVSNGGQESLVQLSRRERFPNNYGIPREDVWKALDPAQMEFALSDVQAGATKLGLDTQVQKLPLAQLQKSGSPALLFLKDDGRIVTLTALDADRAVVVDRGLTRNVERSVLEGRYSGEALVLTKALTQSAGIVADDAVRSVQLPSLDAEVPQQFTLRNTGKTPLTLQMEYPLLGVTESKLSKDTLAPGETATLSLKVKWRSILEAPTQNVLVSLQTNDPIVPRLQLAVLLLPPQATTAK